MATKQRVELKGEIVALKSHYGDIASGFADYRCLFHSGRMAPIARCLTPLTSFDGVTRLPLSVSLLCSLSVSYVSETRKL